MLHDVHGVHQGLWHFRESVKKKKYTDTIRTVESFFFFGLKMNMVDRKPVRLGMMRVGCRWRCWQCPHCPQMDPSLLCPSFPTSLPLALHTEPLVEDESSHQPNMAFSSSYSTRSRFLLLVAIAFCVASVRTGKTGLFNIFFSLLWHN